MSMTERILSSSSSNMMHSCCNWEGWSKKHPLHSFFIAKGINGFNWWATALMSCSSISMTNRCERCEVLRMTDDGSGWEAFYRGAGVTYFHQSECSIWGDTHHPIRRQNCDRLQLVLQSSENSLILSTHDPVFFHSFSMSWKRLT